MEGTTLLLVRVGRANGVVKNAGKAVSIRTKSLVRGSGGAQSWTATTVSVQTCLSRRITKQCRVLMSSVRYQGRSLLT